MGNHGKDTRRAEAAHQLKKLLQTTLYSPGGDKHEEEKLQQKITAFYARFV